MYESSMTAAELIALARDAADISPAVDDEYYLLWLDALEGLIYTGVVREIGRGVCAPDGQGTVDLTELEVPTGESPPRVCDIESVFSDGKELSRADAGAAVRYPEKAMFYGIGRRLYLRSGAGIAPEVEVLYRRRPAHKNAQNYHTARVALPDEFLPMALDYLVGRAYALACEDTQAANRMASYNAALADFALWRRKTEYGGEGA